MTCTLKGKGGRLGSLVVLHRNGRQEANSSPVIYEFELCTAFK